MASPHVAFDSEPTLLTRTLALQDLFKHTETPVGGTLKLLLLSVLIAWSTWWIVKFKLFPKLFPHDPAEVPYTIPCKFKCDDEQLAYSLTIMTSTGYVH